MVLGHLLFRGFVLDAESAERDIAWRLAPQPAARVFRSEQVELAPMPGEGEEDSMSDRYPGG